MFRKIINYDYYTIGTIFKHLLPDYYKEAKDKSIEGFIKWAYEVRGLKLGHFVIHEEEENENG